MWRGAYVVASKDAVDELQRTDHSNERKKDINQLRPLRRLLHIVVVDVLQHLIPTRDAGSFGENRPRRSGSRRSRRGSWRNGTSSGGAGLSCCRSRGRGVAGVLLRHCEVLSASWRWRCW